MKKFKKLKIYIKYFIIFIFIGILSVILFQKVKFISFLDQLFYSYRFPVDNVKNNNIVLIKINDETLSIYGKLPWDRNIWANAINVLDKYNPAIIAIDFRFDFSSDRDKDRNLVKACKHNGKVILPFEYPIYGFLVFPELKNAVKGLGYSTIYEPNKNSEIGYYLISLEKHSETNQQEEYCNFAIEIVKRYLNEDYSIDKFNGNPRIGNTKLASRDPIFGDKPVLPIYFAGDENNFNSIPFQNINYENIDLSIVKDKIVIIGWTGKSKEDNFYTPLSIRSGKLTPGVIIWTNAIYTILNGKYIYGSSVIFYVFLASIIGFIFYLLIKDAKLYISLLGLIISIIILIAINYLLFKMFLFHLNIMPIILSIILSILCCRSSKLGCSVGGQNRFKRKNGNLKETF
ncbi:MAG: CHASE2 domain-containing protein [Candidatus Omnitrophica bacterium]|nr:CHASE2 domain-containing protein [Candidatus Omnitrophota bacterium]